MFLPHLKLEFVAIYCLAVNFDGRKFMCHWLVSENFAATIKIIKFAMKLSSEEIQAI